MSRSGPGPRPSAQPEGHTAAAAGAAGAKAKVPRGASDGPASDGPASDGPASGGAPGRIPLWVDLRPVPVNKRLPYLHAMAQVGAERALLAPDDPHLDREGLAALAVDEKGQLVEGAAHKAAGSANGAPKRGPARRAGRVVGRIIPLEGSRSQSAAAKAKGIVVVEPPATPAAAATGSQGGWTVIPLENLIAARIDRPGTLFAVARDARQAALFATTLERGVHGVVLVPASPAAVREAHEALVALIPTRQASETTSASAVEEPPAHGHAQAAGSVSAARPMAGAPGTVVAPLRSMPGGPAGDAPSPPPSHGRRAVGREATAAAPSSQPAEAGEAARRLAALPVGPATVTAVEDAGVADRVCVDCTTRFGDDEGLLVGSTARSFVLVLAETRRNPFVEPRPFRVNAGAVHSYVLGPDGRTRYLSELAAGHQVAAIDREGHVREAIVGRAKVERRPHLLVRWQPREGPPGMAVLQNAETVRLAQPGGAAVAVTDLKPGMSLLVRAESAARHFGMPVDGSLEER